MKLLSLLFIILFSGFSSVAQSNLEWVFTDSGSVNGGFASTVVLSNGDIFVKGFNDNNADLDPGPAVVTFSCPEFLARYSPAGNLIFARPFNYYNGNTNLSTGVLIKDKNENIYNVFNSTGSFDFDSIPGPTQLNLGIQQYGIAKFDAQGNYKWSFKFDMNVVSPRCAALSDGSILILGQVDWGPADLDPDTGTWIFSNPQGTIETFIAKFDSSGHFVTAKEFHTASGIYPDECVLQQIACDSSNNVYLSGGFLGTVDFDPGGGVHNLFATTNAGGYGENVLLKLDNNLNFVYAYKFYHSDEFGFSLYSDKIGNLFLSGECKAPFDIDPSPSVSMINNQSQNCTFLAKFDPSGIFQWVKTLYTNSYYTSYMYINSFENDGSMYLSFGLTDTIIANSFGFYDLSFLDAYPYPYMYIIKLDSNGTAIYDLKVGRLMNMQAWDFEFTDPTHFYVHGRIMLNRPADIEIGPGIYPLASVSISQFFLTHYSLDYQINAIHGNAFLDLNSNAIHDSIEAGIQNVIVQLTPGPIYVSTDNRGDYGAYVSSGNYTITTPAIPLHLTGPIPSANTASFPSVNQVDTANNFAFQLNPGESDLRVALTEYGFARPAHDINYNFTYSNVGSVTQSGSVELMLDSNLTFLSSTIAPDNIIGNILTWNYSGFLPFQSFNINLTATVSSTSTLGDTILSTVIIYPVAGDMLPIDNYDTSEVAVVTSYDPNSKEIKPSGDIGLLDVVNGAYLTYTIQFQNTGNDTAFSISIHDTLSDKLDLSSLELLASSHPYTFRLYPGKLAEFKFENIFLPDSIVNETGSHGFVKYRVKLKSTLAVGDQIKNTAHIYFDLNTPIATNTVQTEVLFIVIISENTSFNFFDLFPNPAQNKISFRSKTSGHSQKEYRIFDAFGILKLENKAEISSSKPEIDISGLSPGIYFLEIVDFENNKFKTSFAVMR